VQITSQLYLDDFTVEINTDDTSILLPKKSYVRCHKIFIIEQSLILDKISSLNVEKYQLVVSKIIDIIK
jgi:mRNA interferase MazF